MIVTEDTPKTVTLCDTCDEAMYLRPEREFMGDYTGRFEFTHAAAFTDIGHTTYKCGRKYLAEDYEQMERDLFYSEGDYFMGKNDTLLVLSFIEDKHYFMTLRVAFYGDSCSASYPYCGVREFVAFNLKRAPKEYIEKKKLEAEERQKKAQRTLYLKKYVFFCSGKNI